MIFAGESTLAGSSYNGVLLELNMNDSLVFSVDRIKSGDFDVISSVGIADIPGYTFPDGGHLLAVGDCAVCANPSASELASIAISTCDTIKSVTGWIPKCALLSYSTAGSAEGELVDKVRTAVELANERRPDLLIDGEFQLDAAICPEIAKKKVKRDSKVAGQANIVIFPDLNAGNIGVKLIQQFGHANAYGPLLQGFSMICCDCSRSAPVDELVGNIIFSVPIWLPSTCAVTNCPKT